MNFVNYITTILLSLQPSYNDAENWEQRSERMSVIAQSIDDAASKSTCSDSYATSDCVKVWPGDKKSLVILLITKGYWESRFAKNVHEGKCYKYECDAYVVNGNVLHRARSPWQIQKTILVTKEEYEKMNSATLESTTMSATVATRYLALGMNKCHTIKGAMSIYSGAKTCNWNRVKAREQFYKFIEKKTQNQLDSDVEKQKSLLAKRYP